MIDNERRPAVAEMKLIRFLIEFDGDVRIVCGALKVPAFACYSSHGCIGSLIHLAQQLRLHCSGHRGLVKLSQMQCVQGSQPCERPGPDQGLLLASRSGNPLSEIQRDEAISQRVTPFHAGEGVNQDVPRNRAENWGINEGPEQGRALGSEWTGCRGPTLGRGIRGTGPLPSSKVSTPSKAIDHVQFAVNRGASEALLIGVRRTKRPLSRPTGAVL